MDNSLGVVLFSGSGFPEPPMLGVGWCFHAAALICLFFSVNLLACWAKLGWDLFFALLMLYRGTKVFLFIALVY